MILTLWRRDDLDYVSFKIVNFDWICALSLEAGRSMMKGIELSHRIFTLTLPPVVVVLPSAGFLFFHSEEKPYWHICESHRLASKKAVMVVTYSHICAPQGTSHTHTSLPSYSAACTHKLRHTWAFCVCSKTMDPTWCSGCNRADVAVAMGGRAVLGCGHPHYRVAVRALLSSGICLMKWSCNHSRRGPRGTCENPTRRNQSKSTGVI